MPPSAVQSATSVFILEKGPCLQNSKSRMFITSGDSGQEARYTLHLDLSAKYPPTLHHLAYWVRVLCRTLICVISTIIIPKSCFLVPARDHTIDIEGVEERRQEVTLLHVSWAHDLCDTILGQEYLGAFRQPAAWMASIPQDRVEKHESGFKDVKEPLVSDDGTHPHWVKIRAPKIGAAQVKVFDYTVNSSNGYNDCADIQGNKRTVDLGRVDAVALALELEVGGKG